MIQTQSKDVNLSQLTHEHIKKNSDGCWLWTEECSAYGTPQMRVDGAFLATIKVTWWLKHKYKPLWKHMKKKCKTENCLNPDHFTDETPLQARRAELVMRINNMPFFTAEEAEELYKRNQKGVSMKDLGTPWAVSAMTVHKAIKRHMKENGIKRSVKGLDQRTLSIVWEKHLFGVSIGRLANEYRVKTTTLRRAIEALEEQKQDS